MGPHSAVLLFSCSCSSSKDFNSQPDARVGQPAHKGHATMEQRYISNNLPPQALSTSPEKMLQESLDNIIRNTPPLQTYTVRQSGGLFSGYTGLAYLFLQLSTTHPHLKVHGHHLRFWAGKYLEGDRSQLVLTKGNCGLASEKLCYQALVACYSAKNGDLVDFLSNIPMLLGPYPPHSGDPFSSEIVYGRAGVLYLLRLIKHWVPNCDSFVDSPINRLAEMILETDDDGRGNWEWHGKRYFGAAHGEIGIITQLILTKPSLAPKLKSRVRDMLDIQAHDGNWASSERKLKEGKTPRLVQWCHGAPGFIFSLRAIRPYFPDLHVDIDRAMAKAEEITWRHGLLTKEPSLCHGILGNAL